MFFIEKDVFYCHNFNIVFIVIFGFKNKKRIDENAYPFSLCFYSVLERGWNEEVNYE